jgi:predicted phage terminase large subunit-like protein
MAMSSLRREVERLKGAILKQSPRPGKAPSRTSLTLARNSLLGFTKHTFPTYKPDPAHELIAAALDAVVAGEIDRLMIFAPPQHGKSELTSVRLPAYWLGRRPNDPIILSSYAASLAYSKSRQARAIVESQEFATLFPGTTTRRDSRAVDHWQLDGRRGGMLAAGVGGPITGHGGLLGIIDDPLENREQAQSQTIREKVWEWYRTTFRTRIWENGAIVLIQTRWHEDDLAGRLLLDRPGQWSVLRLPAIAESQPERDDANKRLGLPVGARDPLGREPGEPLCPTRFSRSALEQLRRDVGAGAWTSQYQGVPRPIEGNRFKRVWFPVIDWPPPPPDQMPQGLPRVRYWDKAGTAGSGCYTVGLLMCRTTDGLFVVEDVVRGQWSAGERNKVMLAVAQRDADRFGSEVSIWAEQEPGSGGKESAEATVRLLAGFAVYTETVTGSKEVRAEPFAAQAEAGNVRVARAPWNGDYIDEVLSFPTGRFSDQVDASSGAFNHLARREPVLDDEDMPLTFSGRGGAPTRDGCRDRGPGIYEGRGF